MILAFDLSLTSTGYYFLDEKRSVNPENYSGTIKTNLKGISRLAYLEEQVRLLINIYKLDLVVIEGYSYGSKGRAVFDTGEFGGAVKLLLFKKKIPYLIIPPTSLKKFITGKGNSGKELMLLKTYKKYGSEFSDNNICDAFGLAMMGKAYMYGTKVNYEKEALSKVELIKGEE
jgi:crossover junction endodeoxyribonuclease RuvC